ncbi:type I DNA topoisomerase [Candidatus Parcubacteria bacterium]|uniref:DNA topoisomerase 1 n=1 Tax=Candidatus Kaiserbacteria bacterium CG10_big_fil_rev_8_21_14_0_10_47_16 TaxID=1974608 RepID=A0A2H0UCW6_9BACT|nr:type I DNA topoisomerase [Candidatus Parcubacteria bacterium]PIR84249.1 MAG: type I DNA topoisomerase [Candidatus Kaiserbacteria bacterium CG10_big_fil_rev_8_21_14_0_10_47_16]
MSTLVIVESPAKAKTIEKYLGKGYSVKSSVGHVRDLPKSSKDAIDIEGGFVPRYINSPGKEKVIADLRAAAAKADEVLLASDPDREGEAIAWHVAELIKDKNKNLKRIVFHEITEPAVQEAIKHPRAIDINLKEAQEARRVLDRLVGYDLSGLIWKKLRYGLSAGRVQSPALRILMEREREIRAFIPEDFWTLTAHTQTKDKTQIPFFCGVEPREKAEVDRIVRVGEGNEWHITDIKETEAKRSPRPPFTTSTLQQAASTRLGFAPSRTMGAAQKLYEAGHITYMRTDSTNMSEIASKQIIALIHDEYGKEYASPRSYKTKSKSAQEAHEAVRPTDFRKHSVGLTDDQRKLYELIWARAVSSQMADAKIKRTKIVANVKDASEEIPDFAVNGSRVMFDGWLRADTAARGEDVEVPKLAEGDALALKELEVLAKQTQPPNRYTEAGLIKELEKRGIGRPSTYASIMKTIIDRGYVEKDGRTLRPTDTGDVVSSFLEKHFAEYISDTFTSDMEDELDDIAEGKREYVKTLKDFYGPFTKAVASKEDIEKITNLGDAPKEFPCPICSKPMVIKLGRGGKFLSCATFPECDGARMIDGSEIKGDEPLGTHPDTGENIYILTGRFGPYVQLGEVPEKIKGKKQEMPRRASVPKEKKPSEVTLEDAVRYLLLPRELGVHPETGEPINANVGRFGPYIVHAGDFRSLKGEDNPYDITFDRAMEILKEPKKGRAGETMVKEVGLNPKTKNMIKIFESKSGKYLKRGFKRIFLPDDVDVEAFSVEDALELYKQ